MHERFDGLRHFAEATYEVPISFDIVYKTFCRFCPIIGMSRDEARCNNTDQSRLILTGAATDAIDATRAVAIAAF